MESTVSNDTTVPQIKSAEFLLYLKRDKEFFILCREKIKINKNHKKKNHTDIIFLLFSFKKNPKLRKFLNCIKYHSESLAQLYEMEDLGSDTAL